MKPVNPDIKLEVLISAYRVEGLRRVARLSHPQVEGVRYLVSWQPAGDDESDIPDELVVRDDFDISITHSVGSACNRNNAIEHSTGPLLMISDDDLSYTEEQLLGVIAYFESYKKCDLACFRYYSAEAPRNYPDKPFPLRRPAKGYYPVEFELVLRRRLLDWGVRYNEWFGVNHEFIAGEGDIFLHDLLSRGANGWYVPFTICTHHGDTTGDRMGLTPDFIRVKGAVFLHLHPWTWRLRMWIHALRARKTYPGGARAYRRAWITGVADAKRLKVYSCKP